MFLGLDKVSYIELPRGLRSASAMLIKISNPTNSFSSYNIIHQSVFGPNGGVTWSVQFDQSSAMRIFVCYCGLGYWALGVPVVEFSIGPKCQVGGLCCSIV